jgi:hypothetical protein
MPGCTGAGPSTLSEVAVHARPGRPAGAWRVEDDDPKTAAVEPGPRALRQRPIEGVPIVRHDDDSRITVLAALVVDEAEFRCRRAWSEHLARRLEQGSRLRTAIRRLRKVVSRARRNTDEWKAVLLGGRCDDGERPVATGDAECIRAAYDRLTNERRQCPIGADDAHRDPAFGACFARAARTAFPPPDAGLTNNIGCRGGSACRQPLCTSCRSCRFMSGVLPLSSSVCRRSIEYVRHMVVALRTFLTRERWRAGRRIPPRERLWQHPRRAWQRFGSDAREGACDRKISTEGRSKWLKSRTWWSFGSPSRARPTRG